MTLLSDIRKVLTEYSWPGQPDVGVRVPDGGFLLRPVRGRVYVAHAKAMKNKKIGKFVKVMVKVYDKKAYDKSAYIAMCELRCTKIEQCNTFLDYALPVDVMHVLHEEHTTFDAEDWVQRTVIPPTPSPSHSDVSILSDEETVFFDTVAATEGDDE